MGDITLTRTQKALRWWFRHEDRILKAFCLIGGAFVLAALIAGCATMPEDLSLQAHEEKHCEGFTHQRITGAAPFRFEWARSRPESAKPWFYVRVEDTDTTCRMLGSQASQGTRINACAIWKPQGCEIYLPKE